MSENFELISTKEAAKVLGISRSTVYKFIQTGKITYIKIGDRVLLDKNSVFKYRKEKMFYSQKTEVLKGSLYDEIRKMSLEKMATVLKYVVCKNCKFTDNYKKCELQNCNCFNIDYFSKFLKQKVVSYVDK